MGRDTMDGRFGPGGSHRPLEEVTIPERERINMTQKKKKKKRKRTAL